MHKAARLMLPFTLDGIRDKKQKAEQWSRFEKLLALLNGSWFGFRLKHFTKGLDGGIGDTIEQLEECFHNTLQYCRVVESYRILGFLVSGHGM